ncbi:23385_t:CDS:2, partial [Cetraspora pellucida]
VIGNANQTDISTTKYASAIKTVFHNWSLSQNRYSSLILSNRKGIACQQLELELKNEFDEFDNLITNLAVSSEIDDPIDVREFVDINADVAFEMPSDDDIIRNIGNKVNHLTEKEILEPAFKIIDHNTLKALDLIEIYLL